MRILRSSERVGVPLLCLAVAASCAASHNGSSVSASGAGTSGVAGGSGTSLSGGGSNSDSGGFGASTNNATSGGPSLIVSDNGGGDGSTPTTSDGEVCGTSCPAGQAACAPETCDGIDNNCDGVIDNIDKNGDGICDCVLIATLGAKGTAGQGDVFTAWLSARSNNGATNLGDQILTPDLLAKYEVIVAEDVHANHPYSPAEVQALQAWVSNGGGLMTLIGYVKAPGEATNVNTLLQPFGMNYGDMQILKRIAGATIPITQWVAHPVDLGVTAVGIDNGYAVQGSGTMIAMGGGYDVGEALDVGKGHVLLWGDEWITYDSEWTLHPDYQVQLFWLNAIKWLTVAGICQVPIPPGLVK